jgi:hypothetical protein
MSPRPDHAEAHYRKTMMTAITIVFLTLAWLSVLARTWVRAFMIRNFGWDDAVMLLAVVYHVIAESLGVSC